MPFQTAHDYQESNAAFFNCLMTSGQEKRAEDSLNNYTRTQVRELSFMDITVPPFKVEDSECDMQVDTDNLCKVFEYEPNSPGAQAVPFGTTPPSFYLRGKRYKVTGSRLHTPRMTKDVTELRSFRMDIRQIVADGMIKELLAEKDAIYLGAVNSILLGADVVIPSSGIAQWRTSSGGISRNTWIESLKTMPQASGHLEAATVLINSVTRKEFQKWPRDEWGGDGAETQLREGVTFDTLDNKKFVTTIKRGLVPDGTMFQFAGPEFVGKSLYFDDTTVYVKTDAWLMETFAYWYGGMTIANVGGLARHDFN